MDPVEASCFQRAVQRLALYGMEKKPAASHHQRLKRASVLVLISNDGKVLLNQRSFQLRSHPGDVSFPGGKQDPQDQGDDVVTALRETEEEVGLQFRRPDDSGCCSSSSTSDLQLLCRMPSVESINHLCVTPIVAYTANHSSAQLQSKLKLNRSEVEKAFWVPLDFFYRTEPALKFEVEWANGTFIYRKYIYQTATSNHNGENYPPVTGLTAHMVHEVAKLAFASDEDENESKGGETPCSFSGHLLRYFEVAEDARKPYWSRRYFVLEKGIALYQYESERQATRKKRSANKKNRLHLAGDIQVVATAPASSSSLWGNHSNKDTKNFGFEVKTLGDRVVWTLAASSQAERDEWILRLLGTDSSTQLD